MRKLKLVGLMLLLLLVGSCARQDSSTSSRSGSASRNAPRRVEILFLGHKSEHHNSAKFAPMLMTALFDKGINISYTDDPNDLNQANLAKYDGLLLYANHDKIAPEQEQALMAFVESGKGFIPIHSASYCFRNSEPVVKMMGGQFKSHKTGTFTAQIVDAKHPTMQGVTEFETWDETYVHDKLQADNQVIMVRDENGRKEPWTWTRTQGKGRVFYTAYGHDERTWGNPGFHKIVENGILWAVGDPLKKQLAKLDLPAFTYVDAQVPNYEKRDPAPKLQLPLTPEQSMKMIQVPAGFELQLFASEPDIINPIAMAWDERGRLWVVETVDYPNEVRTEDGVGDDRIKICEDTNGDGKADKFTIFADKMNIPTSIVFANGGIIVSQAPQFLFFKDTNGDDKADVRQVIMEGWGKSDTHAGPSNLKYGLDNRIWGTVGYAGYRGNDGLQMSQVLYSFNPDGKGLEPMGRTTNNTWGLGFNENFEVFNSTANGNHTDYFYMPERYLKRVLVGGSAQSIRKNDSHANMTVVTNKIRQVDFHGGYTAAAGHNLYTARSFPKEYWNRIAFVCEPTGRIVHQAIQEPDGAGYKEVNGYNLLASSDDWMAPVHAEVGPDGAVWVADWYDFIIQHNPTPSPTRGGYQAENGKGNAYENPLRDHEKGRIYRVVYKGAKPYTPVKLDRSNPASLVKALENDNMFWRTTAQRLLVESKNTSVLPDLYKLVNNKNVDEIGLNAPAVHALWTMHGLGALSGNNTEALQVAVGALSHPAAGVRRAAMQVLPRNQQALDAVQKTTVISDPNQRTRLAALLAVADMPASTEAGRALYTASLDPDNEKDPALAQALFVAIAKHQNGFNQAAKAQTEPTTASLNKRIVESLEKDIRILERGTMMAANTPDVTGKEITFRGTVTRRGGQGGGNGNFTPPPFEGTLMAMGNKENGYAVYVQDGKLNMQVNQNSKPTVISAPVPEGQRFAVVSQLKQNGAMVLEVDGKAVAQGKAAGLFKQPLTNGVRVGMDGKNEVKVGSYKEDFMLTSSNLAQSFLETSSSSSSKQVAKSAGQADLTITIKVVKNEMRFDKTSFTVKAGQTVELVLDNPDFMQHNWVLIQTGAGDRVGAAADKMAGDPKGAEKNYVPAMKEVLAATELVDPEGRSVIRFKAPEKLGDYPYVCTFPGHWRIMNGTMKVVSAGTASAR